MPRLQAIGVLLCLLAVAAPLRAELILDDFDDPAEVVSPTMENIPVMTTGVGLLNASRGLIVGGIQTDPVGVMDSGVTTPSQLTAELVGHQPTVPNPLPIISFVITYQFDDVDATQAGLNDSILFDFTSIEGAHRPLFLRALIRERTSPGEFFEARITTLPKYSGPTTIAMPFTSFSYRGGSPGTPDFATLYSANFDFFFLDASEDVHWSIELDRIRFGTIPEPSTVWLILFGVMFLPIPLSPYRRARSCSGRVARPPCTSYSVASKSRVMQ